MVKYSATRLDHTFAALADPTRRAIVQTLAQRGRATVSELAQPFRMSLPAVSKHLKVLERAGLVRRQVVGRVHHLQLAPEPLVDAGDWIATYRAFWENQLDALAQLLEPDDDRPPPSTD